MSTSTGAIDVSPEISQPILSTQDSHVPEVLENEEEDQQNTGQKRKIRYDVRNDFSLVTIDGVRKAKCLHCSKDYLMSQGNPTTSLKRHSKRCVPRLASLCGNQELDGAVRKKREVLQPCSTKSLTQPKRIDDDDEWISGGKPRRIDLEQSTVKEEQEKKIPEERPLAVQLEGADLVSSNYDSKRARVTFILDKACLQKGVVGKTAKILNSDEHADFLLKKKKNLDDFRPDILYRALLAIFDSPLRKAGLVQGIYVKIDNGVLFEVKPHVRIPRTIKRFNGLMLELLHKSCIKAKDTDEKLLRVIEQPVTRHLPENSRIIGLSYGSENLVKLNDYVAHVSDDINLVFVVGAMPHGTIDKLYAQEFISISNYPLSTSRCVGEICDVLEDIWDII